jgi:hypothetical protein
MSPEQRSNWRMTGELNDVPTKTTPDSSPAPVEAQPVSTDTPNAPDSDPGTPKKTTPKLQARHAELDADIAALHEKLAARKRLQADLEQFDRPSQPSRPDVTAASSPAPGVPLEQFVSTPDLTRPPLNDTDFFVRYPDATLSDLIDYRATHKLARERQVMSVQTQQMSRQQAFLQRREAAIRENPAFLEELHPAVKALVPTSSLPPGTAPGPLNDAADELIDSEAAPALMVYLSEHPEELERLKTLPHRAAVAREIGRLEGKVSSVPNQPVPKMTTSAPAPAKTLTGRPTAPVDDSKAAVINGDFRRYRQTMNKAEAS